jgi:serine/threonine-protein kinase RsbW
MLYFRRMTRGAQLQLLSRFETIELAEGILAELCAVSEVDDETAYWVGMALRETLANAIKHGNKLNPEKRVHVLFRLEPEQRLYIEVEDEGEGYAPSGVIDPTSPENLMRESGRGIFYIHHFMDEVRFVPGERGGTRVELVKRLVKEQGGVDEEHRA